MSKEATEKTLRRIREQVERSLSRLPSKSAETHNALVFCTGGSFSTVNLGMFRYWTDRSNYRLFLLKNDRFEGTELKDRVVQVHARTFMHQPKQEHHLVKSFQSAQGNAVRAFNDRKGGSPKLDRGPWPITDNRRTNCYVIGSLLDFHDGWNPVKSKNADVTPFMIEWAEAFFAQLGDLLGYFGADVFFLGTGVAPDHPEFGSSVHHFNSRLLRLIKDDHIDRGSPAYPRIYFHDIYTPTRDADWTNWSKQVNGRPVGWSDEPSAMISQTLAIMVPYLRIQCVSSNDRRVEHEKNEKVAGKSSRPDKSTSKLEEKASSGRRDDSTHDRRRSKSTARHRSTSSRHAAATKRTPKKENPAKRTRLNTSPKIVGKADFSKRN